MNPEIRLCSRLELGCWWPRKMNEEDRSVRMTGALNCFSGRNMTQNNNHYIHICAEDYTWAAIMFSHNKGEQSKGLKLKHKQTTNKWKMDRIIRGRIMQDYNGTRDTAEISMVCSVLHSQINQIHGKSKWIELCKIYRILELMFACASQVSKLMNKLISVEYWRRACSEDSLHKTYNWVCRISTVWSDNTCSHMGSSKFKLAEAGQNNSKIDKRNEWKKQWSTHETY